MCFEIISFTVFMRKQRKLAFTNCTETMTDQTCQSCYTVGKVIQKPTRCNNNSFIDLQDQSNMFRTNFCPSSGAQDCGFFLQHMVQCPVVVVGRQVHLQKPVKQLPSYRTRSATLPRSEPLPTATTEHYTICCKKPQSCAPEDGQKFVRNMLNSSWRSIKLLLLHLVGFYITLPTLMMHGQTQIKFIVTLCLYFPTRLLL